MERLRLKKDFQAVFEKGKRFFSPYATALVLPNNGEVVRAGIIVGKKASKKAVVRNRLRRRSREALRTLLKAHQSRRGMDIVILPKVALADAPFEDVKKTFARFLTFNF